MTYTKTWPDEEEKVTAKSRKELLQREDAFITAAEQSAAWVNKYRTALLAGIGAVVLAAAGVWGTSEYLRKRDRDASVIFAEGLRIVELGKVTKPGEGKADKRKAPGEGDTSSSKTASAGKAEKSAKADDDKAKTKSEAQAKHSQNEAGQAAAADAEGAEAAAGTSDTAETEEDEEEDDRSLPTFPSDEEKWKAALTKFEAVVDRAGMRGVGVMAAVLVADLQAKLGDKTGAQTTFQGVQNALTKNDHLFFLAAERAAYLREADGDVTGAIAALDDIAGDDKRFYSDYAQVHQARLYLKKEDKERAKTILEHVEHAFPHSSLSDDVRLQLTDLGVVPATGAVDPGVPSLDGTTPTSAQVPPTAGQP